MNTFLGAFGVMERCKKHHKVWREGEKFERFGGSACEECVMKITSKVRVRNCKRHDGSAGIVIHTSHVGVHTVKLDKPKGPRNDPYRGWCFTTQVQPEDAA